ncbi:hypothetical protein [Singulisphaera acidiphila]|uniref:Uncharacterized protein n=1 Tax=Singulisphaera acidiphila (strain ATCC BAA-1392 / DSM 18658 / VKM B-2454 / MOB10) TaxID=886293 RepID=L0DQF2_SINAD|nr:hypothetical protein [Singulisphaera acidiphila]AGA31143.1 hypothetical protein Sinac_7089 [Singulisphaera acidiphila DSM 18658]
MKRIMAGVLTVVLMSLLAWSGIQRPPTSQERPAELTAEEASNPAETRVHALLESAWKGDVAAYLDAFDGPIKSRLEREVDERGRNTFAADLRKTARARKSHAVFAAEPDGDETARVIVETVYPDRNERQTYRVDRKPRGWLVTEVETLRGHQPKARFGDQADYQAPEGVPVQATSTVSEKSDEEPPPEP